MITREALVTAMTEAVIAWELALACYDHAGAEEQSLRINKLSRVAKGMGLNANEIKYEAFQVALQRQGFAD